ncbi:hypothetical protein ACLB2K_041854 [Fragaria x ananassa]
MEGALGRDCFLLSQGFRSTSRRKEFRRREHVDSRTFRRAFLPIGSAREPLICLERKLGQRPTDWDRCGGERRSDGGEQRVGAWQFYAGKGFTLTESRYPDVEKLALALIVTARRLRHYFQAHSITLYTNHPLRQIMQKPDVSGRLVKWAIELGEFDIHYRPRVAIKGQAAADFISELTPINAVDDLAELQQLVGAEELLSKAGQGNDSLPPSHWKLFVDGSVTRRKSGAEIILETPDGFKHEYALEFQFKTSNNAAEYEAFIGGLQLARDIGVESVEVYNDSQLVVNQVNGSFDAKEPHLSSYQALSKAFMQRFKSASLTHIPRKKNSNADALAHLATERPGKGRKKAMIKVVST